MIPAVDPLDSIRSVIDRHAEAQPNATFFVDPNSGGQCSYAQLRNLCRSIAHEVDSAGVAHGASVAYAMHNGLSAVIAALGLQYGGYRAVSINLVAGTEVIGYVLAHSQTALVITQAKLINELEKAFTTESFLAERKSAPSLVTLETSAADAAGIPTVKWQELGSAVAKNTVLRGESNDGYPPPADDSVSAASDALLMYTSGTTGRPKGVVLSHANVLAGGANVCLGHELKNNDRALCVLPLFHINGLCVTVMGPLVSGGSVVMPEKFSTSKFWQCIEENQCTWFSVVPTQVSYLLRDSENAGVQTSLRFGRSASAPLSPDVHQSFEAQFNVPLIETMGLTETAAQILSNPMPPAAHKLGSPGLPVGVNLRVLNSNDEDVAVGEEGEIVISGDCVMQRYFRNPEATASAFTDDAWLRTGDLGRKDEDGFVFITGRLKELIIKGGENIAPREIDDALYRHADVVEAAAFAVACDSYGQRVEAAVSLRPGAAVKLEHLLVIVREVVGDFKCPDNIYVLDELPKGPSGKIQRKKLSEMEFS